jgi:predicted RNase H-like HicB family nuclease
MISEYVQAALHRALYETIDRDTVCGTVPGLPGVVATGRSLEACRAELVGVIEEWILIRVSRGLRIPRIGSARVEIKRAS